MDFVRIFAIIKAVEENDAFNVKKGDYDYGNDNALVRFQI